MSAADEGWDDGPLDGTRLAAEIARTIPGVNAEVRKAEWRMAFKRRIAERMAARRAATEGCRP